MKHFMATTTKPLKILALNNLSNIPGAKKKVNAGILTCGLFSWFNIFVCVCRGKGGVAAQVLVEGNCVDMAINREAVSLADLKVDRHLYI